jgi:hypothetical protein
MSNSLDYLQKQVDKMEALIYPTIQTTINENKPEIINQQTDVQLYVEGKDANDLSLVPSYAISTVKAKKRKGQKTSNVTLKDTGALYASVTIDALTTEMIIATNKEYFKYLVVHYKNNQILGLQDSFLKSFTKTKVIPNIAKQYKKIIK